MPPQTPSLMRRKMSTGSSEPACPKGSQHHASIKEQLLCQILLTSHPKPSQGPLKHPAFSAGLNPDIMRKRRQPNTLR